MAGKTYLNKDVHAAFLERMDYVFSEFENIYVSFSGGKDSGVLLNLTLDYIQKNKITKRVALVHHDLEAGYKGTADFVDLMFKKCYGIMNLYWFCLPLAQRNATSSSETYWYPWDDKCPELWVRDMPSYPYVYNLKNNPMGEYYEYKMWYKKHFNKFGAWVRDTKGGKVIALIGLRADESLNRYSSIVNKRHDYNGRKWITKHDNDVYAASVMYDWATSDIWHCNAVNDYPYNRVYDLFYYAGLKLPAMRVDEPFQDAGKKTLSLYKKIEPETWGKVIKRVKGVNNTAIYGKTAGMGHKGLLLPTGHTWQSYGEFLLSTLPSDITPVFTANFKGDWKNLVRRILKNDHHNECKPRDKDRRDSVLEKYKDL